MKKRRTKKDKVRASNQKLVNEKRKVVDSKEIVSGNEQEIKWLRADLTKSLWLTMLAVGAEVALWYLLKPSY